MASNVIRATLLADAQRMKAGFKEGEQAVSGFEKRAGGAATAVKAFFAIQAVQAIKDFSMAAINSFSDLEQSVGGTEAVFGNNADAIDAWAKGAADNFGLSEAQARTATTSIGGQLKRMTGDVDFAAEHAMILTEVGADLAATYGGTTADAVAALGAAFRGEADPAERFNLDLKIGKQNAKAVEMGLAKTEQSVDDYARAQATLALIMEQSADAQGQFGREADTVAGQTQRLNAEIENQRAALGEELAPVYLELMGVTKDILPVLGDVAGLLGEVASEAAGIIGPISSVVGWFTKGEEEGGFLSEVLFRLKESALTILMPWRAFTKEEEKGVEVSRDYKRVLDLQSQAILSNTDAVEDAEPANEDLRKEVEKYNEAQRIARERTDLATEALRGNMEAMRELVDPVFNAMNKVKALNEAQARLAELQGDSEASAADLAEAELEVAGALIDAQGAMDGLDPRTLNQSIDAIALALQKPRSEVEQLLNDLGLLDGKTVNTYVNINQITRRSTFSGISADPTRGRQHGGHVNAREPVLVGEAGPEPWIPDTSGRIIPNHKMGSGGGTFIQINVNALDPGTASRAVVQAIQKYIRDNGGRRPF